MITVDKLKSNIEWLIEQYEQGIMLLEQDIAESDGIGNNYRIGQLRASKEFVEHLQELIDEANYEEDINDD